MSTHDRSAAPEELLRQSDKWLSPANPPPESLVVRAERARRRKNLTTAGASGIAVAAIMSVAAFSVLGVGGADEQTVAEAPTTSSSLSSTAGGESREVPVPGLEASLIGVPEGWEMVSDWTPYTEDSVVVASVSMWRPTAAADWERKNSFEVCLDRSGQNQCDVDSAQVVASDETESGIRLVVSVLAHKPAIEDPASQQLWSTVGLLPMG